MPKFGTKCTLFGYFGARILKNYCHVWNKHPRIWLIVKFREKTKMPKLGTKNALFWYFWARILENYCHILNKHLQVYLIPKFCEEQKCLNLRPKMSYLSIFDQKCCIWLFLGYHFKKKHIWNQQPSQFAWLQNIVK